MVYFDKKELISGKPKYCETLHNESVAQLFWQTNLLLSNIFQISTHCFLTQHKLGETVNGHIVCTVYDPKSCQLFTVVTMATVYSCYYKQYSNNCINIGISWHSDQEMPNEN